MQLFWLRRRSFVQQSAKRLVSLNAPSSFAQTVRHNKKKKKRSIMNKKVLLIFLVIASCQTKKENNSNQVVEKDVIETDTENQEIIFLDCEIKDTLITVGDFEYRIEKDDKKNYEISWGDKESKRKYPAKFSCWETKEQGLCNFTPKIDLMTENEIILRVTTSTPSAGNCSPIEYKMIYLPRDEKEKSFEIEYYLKTENNYIVYSNSFDTISIMNLETKKNQSFELNPKPYFEFKTIDNSLDSIQVENKKLKFKYLIGTHEDYGYTKREMKLKK